MPIDTSIYRNQPQPEQPDFLGNYAKMISLRELIQGAPIRRQIQEQQLKSGQQELEANRLKVDAARQAIADDKAARELFAANPNATDEEIISKLGAKTGGAILKVRAEQRKADLEAEGAKVKLAGDKATRLSNITGAIRDQGSYEWGIQRAVQEGLLTQDDLAGIPAQYDPAVVAQFRDSVLTAKEQSELRWKELEEEHKKIMRPYLVSEAASKAESAAQKVAGTEPIQPHQQAQLNATATRDANTQTYQTGMLGVARQNAASNAVQANASMIRANAATAPAGSDDPLVQTVLDNPSVWEDLSKYKKEKIAPALRELGFEFGKPLSEKAIGDIAQSKSAVNELKELKAILEKNKEYVGPISGLQALNPWSAARQAQADIDKVRQRVGKALEGGVLRKEDEEKYKKILATLRDTPETAAYKIDGLITSIENDVKTYQLELRAHGRRVPNAAGGRPDPSQIRVVPSSGSGSKTSTRLKFNPATGMVE